MGTRVVGDHAPTKAVVVMFFVALCLANLLQYGSESPLENGTPATRVVFLRVVAAGLPAWADPLQ